MKKQWKRFLAIALALTLTVGVLSPAASAEDTQDYAVGDLIEFGSYPQTKVTDETLIAALNAAEQTWKSYGYYIGTGNQADGQMTSSDYMQYCDVTCGGQKYRGVRFSQYRPYDTDLTSAQNEQNRNGYTVNTTYWFLWETLQWRVLDPETGLVLCEKVIDAQPYNNCKYGYRGTIWGDTQMTYWFNNYEKSDIRKWLTDETDASSFLNTAFTATQRAEIPATPLDNSFIEYLPTGGDQYRSGPTTDKIFLPSYYDLLNTAYGFSADAEAQDAARRTVHTDYSDCQGLNHLWYEGECSCYWRLRTALSTSNGSCNIRHDGRVDAGDGYGRGHRTSYGIRPAMQLIPVTAGVHTHTYAATVTAPACVESGYTTYRCSVCGVSYTADYTDPIGHQYGDWAVTQPASATAPGTETRQCIRCPATEDRAILPTEPGWRLFSGGYGTQSEPFLIANAVDLDHIDDFYAAYGDNLPCSPVYFTQTANITFFYNDETDNDGTSAYYQINDSDPDADHNLARPIPVTYMHSAVYEGGGHQIILEGTWKSNPFYFVGGDYVGVFGLVTDSTIRNLEVVLGGSSGYVVMIGNGISANAGSAIGRAERCTLDHISVYVTQIGSSYGLLAGSATGCHVTNCFTNAAHGSLSFIGGADSDYTFSNVWAVGDNTNDYYYTEGIYTPLNLLLPKVTGVIIGDGGSMEWAPAEHFLTSRPLANAQGELSLAPLQYDPDAVGLLYYLAWVETVTVTAGAHGTVDGAGVYYPFESWDDTLPPETRTIPGLRPIPDAGYVFTGWDIVPVYTWGNRTMTLQEDGTYTYTTVTCTSEVTVTANFVPHETHTFGAWVVTTPAACTTTGEKTHTCTDCGFTETETIPADGHHYNAVVTDPTCLEGGYTTYTCQNCPDTYTADATDALGHDWGEWTVTTPATTTAEGVKTRECSRCHTTETCTIPIIQAGYGFFSGGYGTADSPFEIATAADFDHIDDFYAAYGDNLPCDPVYFTQTADIAFFCYMDEDDHLITDGTQGYVDCQTVVLDGYGLNWYGWAKPTPVSVMHNAVYDGGGKTISIDARNEAYCILGSEYAGLFGLVTDSTIRNLNIDLGYGNCILCSSDAYTSGGAVGRAENCILDNISVSVVEYMTYNPDGLLAGSAAGCHVTNCFTNAGMIDPSFIGGADSSYTFSNVWAKGVDMGVSEQYPLVTGVIIGEGGGDCPKPQQYLTTGVEGYILVDAQGAVYPAPLEYDPDAVGLLFYACPVEIVTVTAGAHGTVDGAGVHYPYTQIYTGEHNSKTVTGLTPIPDAGYTFAGWEITVQYSCHQNAARTMTLQSDGSYTYYTDDYYGAATVTANFAPHEMHTFDCVQTPATCAEDGQNVYTCTVCGYSYTETVAATGVHDWGEWTVTTPATTTEEGVETRECSRCHVAETRSVPVIPAGYGFFSGGYGTEESPFLIANAVDFDHIDDFYAACGDNLPCDPVYFTQTADITFFYNDETDNDGTSGYYQVDSYDPINPDPALDAYLCWARPTPVTEMYNAFYDGGGHSLQLIGATNGDPLYIVGDQYVGMFGLVTDSAICDLTVDLGYANGLVGTDSAPSVGGVIGRAENCTLDGITVYVNEYMTLGCDLLAGSAAGCTVTDCFINGACQAPSLIGGANSTYTCSNVWVTGEGACGMPDSALLGSVTGVILADGQGVSTVSVQQMLEEGSESFVLVDTQGVVQLHPVQYDPDETGILLYRCPAEIVSVETGEHGSVTGAGVYQPYSQIFTVSYDAPKIITGLTPVPDTGYVFAGWEFTPPESENAQFTRTMTLQSDGSYTYTSDYFCGNVTVTANFAPHEMHTFDCVQTPATCAEDGQNVYTCTVCGYSYTETVAATGVHDWGEWTVTTPATTTAEGVETRECGVCHTTETRGIPQLPATLAVLSLTVPTEPLYTGDTFTVTVDLTQNSGLAAMSLTLGYDPDILTLTNVQTQGMLATGNAVLSGAINTLPYNILWEDGEAHESHTETGTILTLTFVVKEDAAAGNTAILLAYDADSTFDADLQAVPLTVSGASPTIVRHTPGDADSDGKISLLDVASIVRAIAGGWDVQIDARNSDVNGDGVVNLKDVVLLRRFLAGWSVVIV